RTQQHYIHFPYTTLFRSRRRPSLVTDGARAYFPAARKRPSRHAMGRHTMVESLIAWLIVGAIAGWLAGLIVKGFGFGLIGNIARSEEHTSELQSRENLVC